MRLKDLLDIDHLLSSVSTLEMHLIYQKLPMFRRYSYTTLLVYAWEHEDKYTYVPLNACVPWIPYTVLTISHGCVFIDPVIQGHSSWRLRATTHQVVALDVRRTYIT